MNLFLIFSIPISLVLATMFLFREKIASSKLWIPFLRGAIVALAATLILLIVHSAFRWTYTKGNIYLFCFLFYTFIPLLVVQAAFLLFSLFLQYKPLTNPELQYTSYMSGYFTVLAFAMFLIRSGSTDAYLLFYQPFLFLAAIVALPVLSLDILDAYPGLAGYILFGITPLSALILAFIPFFFYINIPLISVFMLAALLGGSGTIFVFLRRKY